MASHSIRTRRRTTPVLAGLALLAACSDSSAPDSPTSYDLTIEILRIFVVGDCEVTPGNAGEFAWRAAASATGGPGLPTLSDLYETSGFPSEAGALEYSEDDSPVVLAGIDLNIEGIAADRVNTVLLTFSVSEWDPEGPDPNMSFRQGSGQVPFDATRDLVRAIDVGASNACKLSFEFLVDWNAS